MKRFIMGVVWLIVFYMGTLMIGGGIAGGMAGTKHPSAVTFDEGYAVGYQGGAEFAQKYGPLIFWLALGGSIAGTVMGKLPGTKKKSTAAPQQ